MLLDEIAGAGDGDDEAGAGLFAEAHDCVSLVEAALKQGKTLEQMKAENVLARYDALGQGFIKTPASVELIYKELTGSRPAAEPASRPGQ